MEVALILLAVAAAVIGEFVWRPYWKRYDERKAIQESCYHDWEVRRVSMGGANYYNRHCRRCGKQEPCNKDGER